MNFVFILAAIMFLGAIVVSQKVAVNAGSALDDATRLEIAKIFPKRNSNYTIIVFAMIVAFLTALYAFPQYYLQITIAYGAAFVIYIFAKLFLNVKKLKEINAPETYISKIVFSFGVFIGGAVLAVIVFAIGDALGR